VAAIDLKRFFVARSGFGQLTLLAKNVANMPHSTGQQERSVEAAAEVNGSTIVPEGVASVTRSRSICPKSHSASASRVLSLAIRQPSTAWAK
jgi:hypothetical protein